MKASQYPARRSVLATAAEVLERWLTSIIRYLGVRKPEPLAVGGESLCYGFVGLSEIFRSISAQSVFSSRILLHVGTQTLLEFLRPGKRAYRGGEPSTFTCSCSSLVRSDG